MCCPTGEALLATGELTSCGKWPGVNTQPEEVEEVQEQQEDKWEELGLVIKADSLPFTCPAGSSITWIHGQPEFPGNMDDYSLAIDGALSNENREELIEPRTLADFTWQSGHFCVAFTDKSHDTENSETSIHLTYGICKEDNPDKKTEEKEEHPAWGTSLPGGHDNTTDDGNASGESWTNEEKFEGPWGRNETSKEGIPKAEASKDESNSSGTYLAVVLTALFFGILAAVAVFLHGRRQTETFEVKAFYFYNDCDHRLERLTRHCTTPRGTR